LEKEHNFDAFELLRYVVEKLKKYETKEKKTSLIEDMTLIGYLNLLERLIFHLVKKDKKRTMQVLSETNLMDEVFYECIFYHPVYTKN